MQWLVDVHKILSNMIAIYALVMGFWGLFNFIRKQAPDGSYNAALAIAVGLFVLEGIVGVFLVLFGFQPARGIHFLYGMSIAITIPAIFAFTRGSNTVRESLFYGIAMLFIWGLAERALDTALNP